MKKIVASVLGLVMALTVAGCTGQPRAQHGNIDALAAEIRMLGPEIDPEEAYRAAHIAVTYSKQLAQEYEITDSPIIHNAKVNTGLRERGLCNHFAEDLTKRMRQEGFRTLSIHWATSPPTPFRIIHHSAVVSGRGGTIYDGILLDPWRYGGDLFWSRPEADKRYDWRPRMEVREELLNGRKARAAN